MLSWTSRCLQKQHPLSETDVDKEKLGQWSRRKQTLHNIIGDVSEKESEKEIQHKEKDQEEVHVGRIFRKPSLPLPILAQKSKEPFVSSSGFPARPKFCIPSSVFSTSATQTERKVHRVEWKEGHKDIEHTVMIEKGWRQSYFVKNDPKTVVTLLYRKQGAFLNQKLILPLIETIKNIREMFFPLKCEVPWFWGMGNVTIRYTFIMGS